MKLKAIIFDYGNVLSEPQDPGAVVEMATMLGAGRAPFEEAYWRFRLAYDEGQFAPESYWRMVADAVARPLVPERVPALNSQDILGWLRPNLRMVECVERVRQAGCKTALLSNMPYPLCDYLRGPQSWLPAFDHLTFSCEVRSSKPGAAIYEHCLEGLGVAAAEALFLDDREPNVEGARALGMQAIEFTNAARAIREIEGYLT